MPEYAEVARAASPRGDVILRARRSPGPPDVLELRVNGVFVMDTAETASEEALAEHALALTASPRAVLVGGLGLGFTARRVLADPMVTRVDVVEIEEALIGWTRDGTVPDHGLLADPRVRLAHADIADYVRDAEPAAYDVVMLDVDNGPGYLVHDANAEVYRAPFLARVRRLLRSGGVLVIWSGDEEPALTAALADAGLEASTLPCPVRLQAREETYWLHAGRR